ncbi:MAG: hypothetical protein RJA66_339 [Actinomycetota bacterium]|jgi:hypothetical protein
MMISDANREWLLDTDPTLKWRVERDLLELPEAVWAATRELTNTTGFGAKLLELQDEDGQWAGGAYFPGRAEPRALAVESDEKGQPYIATTWTLNALREWGVSAEMLGDTADRLAANSRWEYDDLPYWGGEVDCCINAFTLCNGAWLGVDVSKNAEWFLDTQLSDGGWNCEWVEGATKSSFHSTLNSLIGLLEYEQRTGSDERISAARKRAEEYLLTRQLMFKLSDESEVGPWLRDLAYPFRWSYSIIRALNYFRDSAKFSDVQPDERLAVAADFLASKANENGRWVTNDRIPGSVWFDVDVPVGEESKWLTFFALRALTWWEASK